MTGPERESLTLLLEIVRTIQGDIRDVKNAVIVIDGRVKAMEIKDARAVGVAAGVSEVTAHNASVLEHGSVGRVQMFTIVAAAATAAGMIGGLVLAIVDALHLIH
jgi:hypothetical protein